MTSPFTCPSSTDRSTGSLAAARATAAASDTTRPGGPCPTRVACVAATAADPAESTASTASTTSATLGATDTSPESATPMGGYVKGSSGRTAYGSRPASQREPARR